MRSSTQNPSNETFALLEAIASPAALCDASGHFLACNHRFQMHASVQNTSLIGRHIKDVWDADELNDLALYLDAQSDPKTTKTALSCTQLTVQALHTTQGRRFLVQTTARNNDDPLLQFFFAQSDQAYWEYNVREDRFTVSQAWREMRGYGPEDDVNALNRDWLEDVHPDDVEHLKACIAALVSGRKKSIKIQFRRRHLVTHNWLWLMCRATVVEYDENNVPLRVVGTDNDVTEIKQGEADLARLNEKIELAIEASGIGIWEFDSTKSQAHWDDRLLAIYGLEAGHNFQSGDFWAQCIHPDDKDTTVTIAEECARTKSDLFCDFRILRPNGDVRHIRTMARYLDPAATHTKLFGVNIDVTADVVHAQELELARQQLEFDSRHDALTGLGNRRLLDELQNTLSDCIADDQEICIMHLDLDHFKDINDTLGHAAGDAVLVHVARTLTQLIGDQGTLFRMGGDEFVVVFEQGRAQKAITKAAEQIIETLKIPFEYKGHACIFSVSIGAATGRGREALEQNIFGKADIALYAAKRAGRSCFRMYSPQGHASTRTTLKRRQNLLDAMFEDRVTMQYQAQYDPVTGQIVGAEALARVEHPDLGVVSPKDFLPLATETGLLAKLEAAILRHVLKDQTQWAAKGLKYPRVAINLSAQRLANPSLIAQITSEMEEHHAISFELLETAFLDDPDDAVLFNLERLRAIGIPIELDDFGSGHASILALKAVRPDTIKIDRDIVKDIPFCDDALAILRSVISIARVSNARIILEGIERKEHLDSAASLDCDALQGYFLCKPLSGDDFAAMLMADVQNTKKLGHF